MIKKIFVVILSLIILFLLGIILFDQSDLNVEWIKEKYADNESRFIEINDVNVHYKIEGNGPKTILLLHGTGSSLHTWDSWVEELKDSFKIVRLDLPAFGITGPFSDRIYTTDRYLDFLHNFTSFLNLDTIALVGNSFGGFLAWNFTLSYPNKVDKLILVDASGYPSDSEIGVFKLAKNPFTAFLLKKITPRSFILKNLKEVYGNDDLITDSLVDRYWHMARREGNRQAFIDRVNTVYQDNSPSISKINKPTLILWGDQDTWTDVDHARKFNNDIFGSKLIMYTGIGHTVMEEDPKTSVQDAVKFLQSASWN